MYIVMEQYEKGMPFTHICNHTVFNDKLEAVEYVRYILYRIRRKHCLDETSLITNGDYDYVVNVKKNNVLKERYFIWIEVFGA